jgi:hypothetical protein
MKAFGTVGTLYLKQKASADTVLPDAQAPENKKCGIVRLDLNEDYAWKYSSIGISKRPGPKAPKGTLTI